MPRSFTSSVLRSRPKMKSKIFWAWLAILATVQVVQCQAPTDPLCNSENQIPNVQTLMDSYRYNNLIGNNQLAVWRSVNSDNSSATWIVGTGGNCQKTVQVCEPKTLYYKANNWIFTQHIPRPKLDYDVTIYVNVTLRITTLCTGGTNCPRFLLAYYYVVNEQQNPGVYTDVSKYSLLGNITSPSMVNAPFTAVLSFTLKSGDSGFYLGFRDQGSCTYVNRIHAYNYQCPGKQIGLVNLPSITAPTVQNSPMKSSASCVPGAMNATALDLSCSNLGVWGAPPTCVCQTKDGYRDTGGQCEGCGTGWWLDTNTITCQQCPENTIGSNRIAAMCPCSQGFFRAFDELPSDRCTAPPRAPSNVHDSEITGDSITISWDYNRLPEERDDYYFILYYRAGGEAEFIYEETISNTAALSHTFHHLASDTVYELRLITMNGVSDQDKANEALRTVTITRKTAIQVPGAVSDVTVSGRYVIWQPPEHPNGAITGYSLLVIRDSQEINITVEGLFYHVQDDDIPDGNGTVYVQVCAINLAGHGECSARSILAHAMTPPGHLALQSSGSCVMWFIPQEPVTYYKISYSDEIITNHTANWYCLQNVIQDPVTIEIVPVNSAGDGPISSIKLVPMNTNCHRDMSNNQQAA